VFLLDNPSAGAYLPTLVSGGLPGVVRAWAIEQLLCKPCFFREIKHATQEKDLKVANANPPVAPRDDAAGVRGVPSLQ